MLIYNKSFKEFSQWLRNNMTDAEIILWQKLKRKQLKGRQFYRQKTIGRYIVDFYCAEAKLAIELDGGQHYFQEGKEEDIKRDDYLISCGLRVLRFSNTEIMKELETVLERIWDCL